MPCSWARLTNRLKRQRAAVIGLDRKDMGGVVVPRPCSCELDDRHDLDRIDAELFQMLQPGRHRGELAGHVVVFLVVERADMQFVDDELVPRCQLEVVPGPVEARVVDDGIADRIGHLAGIRVNALELALRGGQQELVLIADMRRRYVGVPVPFASDCMGCLSPSQPLNDPMTETRCALGAHTRKAIPPA